MSGRPYDALYDPTYVTSSARDHYRQQTVAGGFMVERAPEYSNMFSKLPQYPSTTFRLKNSDRVPAFVDRTFHPDVRNPPELAAVSRPEAVAGTDRYKYFRRPLLSMPTHSLFKEALVVPPPPPPVPPPLPKARTIGTQSDYRESEAQTTPWEPDVVMPEVLSVKQQHLLAKHHCMERAELAYLKDLKFGDGLPPGMHEVWRIEKMRAKRAFEATLPPLEDLEQLPRRQRMIEEWEAEEWREREKEILGVHDERLNLLEQALLVREEELDEVTMQKVEARKTLMLQQKASNFASIQANRIKTMRQLVEARKYIEKPRKLHKQTIVERYANFGSTAYAPVQREGRFPEAKPKGLAIETEGYQPVSLPGVVELESYLPPRLLNPKIADLSKPVKMDYKQRQEAAIQRDLKAINDLLDTAKATKGRGIGECWPAPLKNSDLGLTMMPGGRAAAVAATLRAAHQANTKATTTKPKTGIRGAADRPEATELPPPLQHGADGNRNAAAMLLQRLLRGRAVQNVLYEGKTRRLELIQELRIQASPLAATTRPEDTPGVAVELDAMLGAVISGLAASMALEDPESRAAALAAALDPETQPVLPDFNAPAATAAAQQHFAQQHQASSESSSTSEAPPAAEPAVVQSEGTTWLRHMEAAQRGEGPSVAQVVAEEVAATAEASSSRQVLRDEDEVPHNYELLMQAMAGLTGIGSQGPQPLPAPPPAAADRHEPVGREVRAAAAAAAAEARLQAAVAAAMVEPGAAAQEARPGSAAVARSEANPEAPAAPSEEEAVAMSSSEAVREGEQTRELEGEQVPEHSSGTEDGQQQRQQQPEEEGAALGIPAAGEQEAAEEQVEQQQQQQQQLKEEGAAPNVLTAGEAEAVEEQLERQQEQQQMQHGEVDEQAAPGPAEATSSSGAQQAELQQEEEAQHLEGAPAQQFEQSQEYAEESDAGPGPGPGEGAAAEGAPEGDAGVPMGAYPPDAVAAAAAAAEEAGPELAGSPMQDEGESKEDGKAEVDEGELQQEGEPSAEQASEGAIVESEVEGQGLPTIQHSEDLQGEPSFGGQAGGQPEEEGDAQGYAEGTIEQESGGDVTLHPHQQHEQHEELVAEPSLGHTLGGEPGEGAEGHDGSGTVSEGEEGGEVTLHPHQIQEQDPAEGQEAESGDPQ